MLLVKTSRLPPGPGDERRAIKGFAGFTTVLTGEKQVQTCDKFITLMKKTVCQAPDRFQRER